jgi:hypothetical protein
LQKNERAKVGRYRLEERIMAKFEVSHCTRRLALPGCTGIRWLKLGLVT